MTSNGHTHKESKRDPLVAPRFQQAEYARNIWRATLAEGTTPDEIMEPRFWSFVAVNLKPGEFIEVVEETQKFVALLYVTGCDRTWATVAKCWLTDLQPAIKAVQAPADDFVVEWKGQHHKHCVIRTADGEKVKTGCQTKDEATVWMNEHRKTVAV